MSTPHEQAWLFDFDHRYGCCRVDSAATGRSGDSSGNQSSGMGLTVQWGTHGLP